MTLHTYYCIVKALCGQEKLDVSFGERERKIHRDLAGNLTWDQQHGCCMQTWFRSFAVGHSDKSVQLVIRRS